MMTLHEEAQAGKPASRDTVDTPSGYYVEHRCRSLSGDKCRAEEWGSAPRGAEKPVQQDDGRILL